MNQYNWSIARFTAGIVMGFWFLLLFAIPCRAVAGPSTTLAVMPFENNAVSAPEKYEPLSKGLMAMLISDLSSFSKGLNLIERNKIATLLKELALSQSGMVTEATALQAGKILGAAHIAFGSFMVIGSNVRMDVRVVEVETSKVVIADSVMGKDKAFMSLERQLAKKIAGALNQDFSPPQSIEKGGMDAALYFSEGLEAMDSGNQQQAETLFEKSRRLNPHYGRAIESEGGGNR